MGKFKHILDEITPPIIRAMKDGGDAFADLSKRLNTKMTTDVDRINAADRIDVSTTPFNPYRAPHRNDVSQSDLDVEFDRQLREQLDELEGLSLLDYMRNRDRFLDANGRRPSASNRAQRDAHDNATEDEIAALIEAGLNPDNLAALHRLDIIAGGNPTRISGLGDSGVNSSLGSQWKARIADIDQAVLDYVAAHPEADLSTIGINLTFN